MMEMINDLILEIMVDQARLDDVMRKKGGHGVERRA